MLAASPGFFWAMAEIGKVNRASKRNRVFIITGNLWLPADSRSSTISGKLRVAVSNGNPIPLTLTLSHGERQHPAPGSVVREARRTDTALGFADNQRRFLPLPEGDARGEGEGHARGRNGVGSS